jgi:putative oxidoreductase
MNSLMKKVDLLYSWFLKAANFLQSIFLLGIRVFWGWQFWQAGHGKLANIAGTIENFKNMGVPAPAFNAHFIGLLEAGGGILLILGLASRIIAIPMTINMIMAYLIADREAWGSFFSDSPEKFFSATPFPFLVTSILILLFGPGMFSLDTLIVWYRKKREKTSTVSGS